MAAVNPITAERIEGNVDGTKKYYNLVENARLVKARV
jgi:hypothetical protein